MMEKFRSGISMRWLNNAGFEVILPSGAHLFVDPWLDTADVYPVPIDTIERMDYVLLTHVHFDHADSIGAIQKKFPNVRILMGDLSVTPMCKWHHLNVEKIFRIRSGEVYEFDGVKIEVIAGRHTESRRGSYYMEGSNVTKDGELDAAMWYGSLEMFNFRITASDGTTMVVWGGMTTDEQINRMKHYSNNDIAVMHVSAKQKVEMFNELVNAINPKVVIPHHYDLWDVLFTKHPELLKDSPLPPELMTEEYILGEIGKAIEKGCPHAQFFKPEHHKWYRFGLYAECNEE